MFYGWSFFFFVLQGKGARLTEQLCSGLRSLLLYQVLIVYRTITFRPPTM